ncbi:MAG: hypothetical protein KBG15_09045 [Kofleriaceae bacterium]|nr:hypothetical protein [Kofleriaceae bacterium]
MMGRRRLVSVLAMVAAGPAASSYAESRAKYGGTLEASLVSDARVTDPVAARAAADIALQGLLHESLYRSAADGPMPTLASAPPQFETALRVRIVLRTEVTFHDGTPITVGDAVASLERLRTSPSGWLIATVASVRADAGALVITLTQPTPNLAALLALPQAAITPGGRPPVADAPIGAGPFSWGSRDDQRRFIELKAFDNYVGNRAYVEKVRLHWFAASDAEARRFEAGAAHISLRGATAFSGAAPKFLSVPQDSLPLLLTYLGFGPRHGLARQAAFRRAVDEGIARSGFAALGSGEKIVATRIPLASASVAASARAGQFAGDIAAARREYAGVPRTAVSAVEILIDASALDDREIAERVVRVLDKLGVVATVMAVDAATFQARLANQTYDLYIGQLVLPVTLAPLWWTASFALAGARSNESAATLAAAFRKIVPIVPLFHRSVRAWVRSDLRGATFDGLARLRLDDASVIGAPVKANAATTPTQVPP